MAQPKQPTVPKAPAVQNPVSTNTGFGGAQYQNGAYTLSANQDPQANQNVQSAEAGYGNSLQQLQNPQQAINQAMQVYSNAETPAFNLQQQTALGQLKAGLGNANNSTFGQLTENQAAQQSGLAAAQLQQNIYNAGQSQYTNMLNNANLYGTATNNAIQQQMMPYQTLGQITAQLQPGVSNVNSTNAANYGTQGGIFGSQAGMFNAQTAANAQQNAAALEAAGQTLKAPNISVIGGGGTP